YPVRKGGDVLRAVPALAGGEAGLVEAGGVLEHEADRDLLGRDAAVGRGERRPTRRLAACALRTTRSGTADGAARACTAAARRGRAQTAGAAGGAARSRVRARQAARRVAAAARGCHRGVVV